MTADEWIYTRNAPTICDLYRSTHPRSLNIANKREHAHLPTIEEIMARISGEKYFSNFSTRDRDFGKFL